MVMDGGQITVDRQGENQTEERGESLSNQAEHFTAFHQFFSDQFSAARRLDSSSKNQSVPYRIGTRPPKKDCERGNPSGKVT